LYPRNEGPYYFLDRVLNFHGRTHVAAMAEFTYPSPGISRLLARPVLEAQPELIGFDYELLTITSCLTKATSGSCGLRVN
jgi:hypothetical protein